MARHFKGSNEFGEIVTRQGEKIIKLESQLKNSKEDVSIMKLEFTSVLEKIINLGTSSNYGNPEIVIRKMVEVARDKEIQLRREIKEYQDEKIKNLF